MRSIFNYSDYRLFLKEYLQDLKSCGSGVTYEELARALGFSSKGFLTQIIQGKSKLPADKIEKLGRILRLGKKEREYFALLAAFDNARTHREKNTLFQKLTSGFKTRIAHIGPEKYEYYSKWYYSAIRSLLGYYAFDGDYKKLGKQLCPAITPGQAKKSIRLLERLSLLEKREDGWYNLTNRMISTGDTVDSVSIINFQQATMDLAKAALETVPKNRRSDSTLTLGLSEAGYRSAVEKIETLRKELMNIAHYDRAIDRVIQVNLHAFPLTGTGGGKKR